MMIGTVSKKIGYAIWDNKAVQKRTGSVERNTVTPTTGPVRTCPDRIVRKRPPSRSAFSPIEQPCPDQKETIPDRLHCVPQHARGIGPCISASANVCLPPGTEGRHPTHSGPFGEGLTKGSRQPVRTDVFGYRAPSEPDRNPGGPANTSPRLGPRSGENLKKPDNQGLDLRPAKGSRVGAIAPLRSENSRNFGVSVRCAMRCPSAGTHQDSLTACCISGSPFAGVALFVGRCRGAAPIFRPQAFSRPLLLKSP
jgi:hypothetical protein